MAVLVAETNLEVSKREARTLTQEEQRLEEARARTAHWKR